MPPTVYHELLLMLDDGSMHGDLHIFFRRYIPEFASVFHKAVLGPLSVDLIKGFLNNVIADVLKFFDFRPFLNLIPSKKNLQASDLHLRISY